MALLTALLLGAFGALFQFSMFLRNDFSLIFILFFLFQLAMASTAFLLSTGVGKASTAVNLVGCSLRTDMFMPIFWRTEQLMYFMNSASCSLLCRHRVWLLLRRRALSSSSWAGSCRLPR